MSEKTCVRSFNNQLSNMSLVTKINIMPTPFSLVSSSILFLVEGCGCDSIIFWNIVHC